MAGQEVKFENFHLNFDLDWYSEDCANATVDDIWAWQEKVGRSDFARFGIKWNVDKQAWIASITVYGKGKGDPSRCTTAFGKSPLSAFQKLLYLVEYARWIETDEDGTDDFLRERELEIRQTFKKPSK